MALSRGQHVVLHDISDSHNVGIQPQPLRIGVVDDLGAGGTFDVLWDDGVLQQNIDPDSLDRVELPEEYTLVGKVVEMDVNLVAAMQLSSSFDATVISRFRRDPAGGGSPGEDRVLCKLLNVPAWYETYAANVSPLHNR